jgi:hypothetical protein
MLARIASALNPYRWIAIGIAVLAIVSTVALHFRSDARTRDALAKLRDEAETVVLATQAASGNDSVTWQTAPGQIIAIGDSNRRLKESLAVQNEAIDDMARREVAAKAEAKRLTEIARKAEAQRASALRRLSDLSLTPGTRGDCLQLLSEAEDALDIAHRALKGRDQ